VVKRWRNFDPSDLYILTYVSENGGKSVLRIGQSKKRASCAQSLNRLRGKEPCWAWRESNLS
jgi:hypothetical protein